MQLEVGSVIEGKVTGITKFGAFVELPEGKTGMVHISEVAPVFVKEIRDHVQEGQTVKVKILSIAEDGKISLSIKKAMDQPQQQARPPKREGNFRRFEPKPVTQAPTRPNYEWQKKEESGSFEDMMQRFKQTSDEKISDLKKVMDGKRSGYSRHGGSQW